VIIFYFFFEKIKKKCVPLFLFLSRCTHFLDILSFNVFQQHKLVIMTKKSGLVTKPLSTNSSSTTREISRTELKKKAKQTEREQEQERERFSLFRLR
jgi:hypothetical protein